MKRIIDGKAYNTETATLLAGWSFSHIGDFNYYEEEIYKTKKGNFFLYKSGGPFSTMGVSCGNNSSSGSSDIELISKAEIQAWINKNNAKLDEDDLETLLEATEIKILEG